MARTAAGVYGSQLLQGSAFCPSSSQRARTKHPASLLIGLLLIVCCLDVDGLLGGGWYAGGLGEGNQKPGPGGLGCMV